MEGACGVDLADGQVRRRLLADQHVHRVRRLLAHERHQAQEQLRVRTDGGQLKVREVTNWHSLLEKRHNLT